MTLFTRNATRALLPCAIAFAGVLRCCLPVGAASVALQLSHWKVGVATAVAKCGGGIAAVQENEDSLIISESAKRAVLRLAHGSRPRDIIAGGNGTCLVLESGRGKIAIERKGRIISEISVLTPSGGPYSLDRSSLAYDGTSIFVTVPDVQAVVRIRADGTQESIGTAFGDEPKDPRGWLFHAATAPKAIAQQRLAPDVLAVPPFPQDGWIGVAPDKAVWIIRYGGDPLNTELLRYSAQMNGFTIYPLAQMGFGAVEPANLVFTEVGWVAFTSQTPGGLRSISISPFGEYISRVIAPGAMPSRIGLSDRSSAYDVLKRIWVVDADHRRLLLLGSRLTCVRGPWKDPVSLFDLSKTSFGVLDAASGTVYFVDPAETTGAPCPYAV